MAKKRAAAIEEKATPATMVMKATKEAVNSIKWYKASVEFKDEMREAVCDTFVKGFEECKRKMG